LAIALDEIGADVKFQGEDRSWSTRDRSLERITGDFGWGNKNAVEMDGGVPYVQASVVIDESKAIEIGGQGTEP
jgi:hypothetical protein